MKKYLYYKLTKEVFNKMYKLTDEDTKKIEECVNTLGLSRETATELRKHKIYEDSKWDDPEFKKRVFDKHVEEIDLRMNKKRYL